MKGRGGLPIKLLGWREGREAQVIRTFLKIWKQNPLPISLYWEESGQAYGSFLLEAHEINYVIAISYLLGKPLVLHLKCIRVWENCGIFSYFNSSIVNMLCYISGIQYDSTLAYVTQWSSQYITINPLQLFPSFFTPVPSCNLSSLRFRICFLVCLFLVGFLS